MTIAAIDHVNIQTRDLAGTVAFYRDVLGLREGESVMGNRGAWMLDEGGRAVVHLGTLGAYPDDLQRDGSDGGGSVHHVAFLCHDYDQTRAQLEKRGLLHTSTDLPTLGLRQLFLYDPNGVLLELNFRDEP